MNDRRNDRTIARTGAKVGLLLTALLFLSTAAFSRATAEKLERAAEYYDQGEKAYLALQELPAEQRRPKDYLNVVRTFLRVYQTAPTSAKVGKSFMNIAEVYQQMARELGKEKYFASAIQTYDFLMQEYPYSKYQPEALLETARIYRSNLKQPEEALKRLEKIVEKFPGAPQAAEARLAITEIQTETAARKLDEPKPATRVGAAEKTEKTEQAERTERTERGQAGTGDLIPITDIRQWVTASSTRVVISLNEEAKYEVGTLDDPPRVYVDLQGTKINRALARKTLVVDGGLVKRLRAAQYKVDVARVVLEMDKLTDYSVFDLPNPYRLIIDIRATPGHAPMAAVAVANVGHESQSGASVQTTKSGKDAAPSTAPTPLPSAVPAEKHVAQAAERTEAVQDRQSAAADKSATPLAAKGRSALKRDVEASDLKPGDRVTASQVADKSQPIPDNDSRSTEKGKLPVADKARPARLKLEGEAPDAESSHKTADKPAGPIAERVQPALPNSNGTRSLTRALGLKIGRIILDPGHGGHDTGTIGPSGLYEKDLVLDVAQRLGKLISERLGSEVIYTREDDTFIPLESRTAIANEKQADLFLSIHANSSSSQSARGVETYYLSFATDPGALSVAARENAVSQESIHELQDLVKKIALNDKVDESKEFASDVQSALRDRLSKGNRLRKDRGVKKAPFMVLVGARMPSVLAEISFLSNPQEETLLRTKAHRQKIAEALYAGVKKYADTLSGVKVARNENLSAAAK